VRAQDSAAVQSAQEFFDRFVALERAYDPAVAALYADDAVIQSVRRLPDGTGRTVRIVGADYKRLIRTAMPIAQRRGERDRFSEVTISVEGNQAHIRCTRYNELKRYATPYELVLERTQGNWQIIEEYSQSRR
jgi:ketosteroid isomerase-like protein